MEYRFEKNDAGRGSQTAIVLFAEKEQIVKRLLLAINVALKSEKIKQKSLILLMKIYLIAL